MKTLDTSNLISITLYRSSMFGAPSNTITKSLMVGYGVPLVIVLIMGIGIHMIFFNQNYNLFQTSRALHQRPLPPHPTKVWCGVSLIFPVSLIISIYLYFSGRCLFYGKLDKFVWFLGNFINLKYESSMYSVTGPILIMLMINTFMFFYIAVTIFRQQMWGNSGRHCDCLGAELFDNICIYLK